MDGLNASVIQQAKRGDERARQGIADLLMDKAKRMSGHYANLTGMDRDDLLQEFWVGVMIGLDQVNLSIGDPLYYLFLRGKWRMLEAIRRSDRESHSSIEELSTDACPRTLVAEPHAELEAGFTVQEMNRRMSTARRNIFSRLREGYQQEEIARQLGCTAANVSYHVKRIRILAREVLAA